MIFSIKLQERKEGEESMSLSQDHSTSKFFRKKLKVGGKVQNIPSGNLPKQNVYKCLLLESSVFPKVQVESFWAQ